ncbi:MAG: ATP synthase F1 subunit delta [Phycisphaerales bacterium JB065]
MPLFESPPEAVDKVYAKSLFELAEAEGGRERLESLAAELDEFVEVTRAEAQLSEFLSSRILATKDRAKSLSTMFDGRISDLLLRFLQVLNRKERLGRLLSIVAAFQEMVQEKFGRIEVNVYTRESISADQIASIKARLQAATGREPVIYPYTVPGMIGGVKMQIGDRLFDDSIQTSLRNMTELVKEDGSAVIRTMPSDKFLSDSE